MKGRSRKCIFILADVADKIADMDAAYLLNYLTEGYSKYLDAEEAEEGRQRGDAYDEPFLSKVIGFEVKPFVVKMPKKKTESKGRRQQA